MKQNIIETMHPEIRRALNTFAMKNGKTWKSKLLAAWYTGRYPAGTGEDSGYLQQCRNIYGPAILDNIKL